MGCLRLFLAICVVIEHVPLAGDTRLLRGDVAVESFFMLSGFYMALVLDGKYRADSWPQISTFYASRFLRLWPTFILVTLASYALWLFHFARMGRAPMSVGPILEWADPWFATAARISNVTMIGQDLLSLFHVSEADGAQLTLAHPEAKGAGWLWAGYAREIGPAWSIGTELWFYLFAPFLVRLRTVTLLGLAAALLGLRYYMEAVHDLYAAFFSPTQLPLFLAGMLAYRFRRHRLSSHPLAVAVIPAVVIAWTGAMLTIDLDPRAKWLLYPILALGLPALFSATKDIHRDRIIGELSYPVYMVHMFVLSLVGPVARRLNIPVTGDWVLLFVLAAAYAIFHFVERPLDGWRQAFVKRRAEPSSDGAIHSSTLRSASRPDKF